MTDRETFFGSDNGDYRTQSGGEHVNTLLGVFSNKSTRTMFATTAPHLNRCQAISHKPPLWERTVDEPSISRLMAGVGRKRCIFLRIPPRPMIFRDSVVWAIFGLQT